MAGTAQTIEIADIRETKVGNYFVSNYPPYSFWTTRNSGRRRADRTPP